MQSQENINLKVQHSELMSHDKDEQELSQGPGSDAASSLSRSEHIVKTMKKVINREGYKSSKPNLLDEQRKKRQTAAKRNARNNGLEQTSLYCSKEFVLSDDVENQPAPHKVEMIDNSKPPTMR